MGREFDHDTNLTNFNIRTFDIVNESSLTSSRLSGSVTGKISSNTAYWGIQPYNTSGCLLCWWSIFIQVRSFTEGFCFSEF